MSVKHQPAGRFIFKIHSTRLRKSGWNLTLDIPEAMKNSEIVSIADNTLIRFIDECSRQINVEENAERIMKTIQNIRKNSEIAHRKKELLKSYQELNQLLFIPDILHLIIDNKKDYIRAFKKGFFVNGIKYCRLLATTGGIKKNTIVFTSERLTPELKKRIQNGRNPDIPLVPAKYGAYEALTCSSSIPVSDPRGILVVHDCYTHFYEDILELDDSREGEPLLHEKKQELIHKNCSDGYGLMLPSRARLWSRELGLDYLLPGCNTRYAWEKGMLITFDFLDFAEKIAGASNEKESVYFVKDVWGNEMDIRKADVILTESMLKLWQCYDSIEDYIDNCNENSYEFSITKICPCTLEHVRTLNYQFLQSYRLSDNELNELIQPAVNEFHEVLGEDVRKSILFTKGTCLNDTSVESLEDDCIKALMIEPGLSRDPFVRSYLHKLISKKIMNAKTGSIKINGNYQTACTDPYALCQSIFSLPVTGILQSGELYSKYWAEHKTNEVVCFRAPMTCHNNIRKMKILHENGQALYWYRYLTTLVIFNCWDSAMEAMNGEDCDGDQNFLTNNPVLLANTRNEPPIFCRQHKAPKKLITEEDLVMTNIESFGDEIGIYTNGITAQFDIQSLYAEDSKEYKELEYRIMCGQLFQQNAIDKAKGILSKSRPGHWFNYVLNIVKDDDSEDIICQKQFNQSIVADKKPYFMCYIYPQSMKEYKKYVSDSNKKCLIEFQIPLEEMLHKKVLSDRENEFLNYYHKYMPVTRHPSLVNKICFLIEQEFDGYLNSYREHSNFDYSILKSPDSYSPAVFLKIKKIYQEYCDRVSNYQRLRKRERLNEENTSLERSLMLEAFRQECFLECPDKKQAANILIDLCYPGKNSKQFVWDLCAETIIENLLEKNNGTIWYPRKDPQGEFHFCGEYFSMQSRQIGGQDDTNCTK